MLEEIEHRAAEAEIKAGQFVMIAVGDTGHGIPPDIRDRVSQAAGPGHASLFEAQMLMLDDPLFAARRRAC